MKTLNVLFDKRVVSIFRLEKKQKDAYVLANHNFEALIITALGRGTCGERRCRGFYTNRLVFDQLTGLSYRLALSNHFLQLKTQFSRESKVTRPSPLPSFPHICLAGPRLLWQRFGSFHPRSISLSSTDNRKVQVRLPLSSQKIRGSSTISSR